MNRAGSVGFHVPSRCCHCRVSVPTTWKLCDRFLARIASRLVTTTCAPRGVGLLHDHAAVGIDQAEAAERLIRSARIDAVDVDLGVGVLEVAAVERQIEADLSGELLGEADRVLVDEGLVQVGIERQAR